MKIAIKHVKLKDRTVKTLDFFDESCHQVPTDHRYGHAQFVFRMVYNATFTYAPIANLNFFQVDDL